MKLPSYKRLIKDDYPKEDQPLVDSLSFSINSGFDSLFNLANKNISFKDNIANTFSIVQVTVDSSGIPTRTVSYPLSLTTSVDGTQVISAISATNSPIYATSTPFITGSKNQNNFIIQHVSGLPANVPFNLTIITYQN